MRVAVLSLALLVGAPWAFAQQKAEPALNAQQLEGLRHFNQACRVCHTKPQLTSPQYAPVLNSGTLGGSAGAMKAYIANGSQRMPGFRVHFRSEELDALVAYIRTIERID